MNDKRSRAAPILVASVLVLFPILYVGSYAVLAKSPGELVMGNDGICYKSHYRYGGRAAEVLFWPVWVADRQLRPPPEPQ